MKKEPSTQAKEIIISFIVTLGVIMLLANMGIEFNEFPHKTQFITPYNYSAVPDVSICSTWENYTLKNISIGVYYGCGGGLDWIHPEQSSVKFYQGFEFRIVKYDTKLGDIALEIVDRRAKSPLLVNGCSFTNFFKSLFNRYNCFESADTALKWHIIMNPEYR